MFDQSKFKYPIAFIALASSFSLLAANQHQVSAGFADLIDFDQGFFGVGYQYYFDDLSQKSGPHSLKAYLHKVDSLEVSGFSSDNWDYTNLAGTMYFAKDFMLDVEALRFNDSYNKGDITQHQLRMKFAKSVDEHIQVGMSLLYSRKDWQWLEGEAENRYFFAPFIRYSAIEGDSGWDFMLQPITGKERYYQGRASYYVNARWSVTATTLVRSRDVNDSNIELQTEYWFADFWSVKMGVGSKVGEFGELSSVSLLTSIRF